MIPVAVQVRGELAPAGDRLRELEITLARAGWEIRTIDLDLVAGRAVLEIHRADGRWLYLAADSLGRASVERWHREAVVTRYRGGPQCDSHRDQFLGRTRFEGPRAALRHLSRYVADNPAPGWAGIEVGDVRGVLAPLMAVPVQIDGS